MINYDKLFKIMNRRNIKKTELLKIISPATLSKLNKGMNLQTEVIEKICDFLSVQPGDIMTYSRIIAIEEITAATNTILYNAGYKEMLYLEYPEETYEFDANPITTTYCSKKTHEDKDAIIREEKPIPNDFIDINTIEKKDPNYIAEINKLSKKSSL